MTKIKVAIVDDHKILRDGLKALLQCIEDVEVIFEAANGKEFIDQIDTLKPDLAIVDINMPIMSGDEAIAIAKQKDPNLKIIVLSMNRDEQFFKTLNNLGVDGYIIKESDYEELEHAINTVLKGGKYFSQELLLGLVNNKKTEIKIELSQREQEVLNYLCKGLSANEIAEKMFISPRTVEKYRSDLLLRTESANSISLVVFAIKNGLVTLQ